MDIYTQLVMAAAIGGFGWLLLYRFVFARGQTTMSASDVARMVFIAGVATVAMGTVCQEASALYMLYNQKSIDYNLARSMGKFCAMNEATPERHMETIRQQCDRANITIHSSVLLESILALTDRWPSVSSILAFDTLASRLAYAAAALILFFIFYRPSERALRKFFNDRRRRDAEIARMLGDTIRMHQLGLGRNVTPPVGPGK